jgi:signal transduction histidine kinase
MILFKPFFNVCISLKKYTDYAATIANLNKTLHLEREQHQAEIIKSVSLERQKIFQDIHDGLGSKLLLAVINLRAPQPNLLKAQEDIALCLDELRFIVNSDNLADADLKDHLHDLCIKQALHFSCCGIDFSFKISNRQCDFSLQQKINMIRIVQECLSNVLKHSKASKAFLNMREMYGVTFLAIADNGTGLATPTDEKAPTGRGISGIKKRIQSLGAKYKLSTNTKGTRWIFSIPAHPAE